MKLIQNNCPFIFLIKFFFNRTYFNSVFMFYFADGTYFSFVVLMERYIFRNIYMSGCCVPDEKKPWVLVLHNLHSIRSYCNYVVDIILDTTREYSSQVLEFFLYYSRQVLESFIVLQLGTRVLYITPVRYWSMFNTRYDCKS